MHHEKESKSELLLLGKIKCRLMVDVRKYLLKNWREVLEIGRVGIIDDRTRIGEDFFDDFLGARISVYMPIDLKDILALCLEEPMIIADLARFTSSEPTTLMIIKDAIRFYLKDYVYRNVGELVVEMKGE